ncbi:NAD-dependent malic enzyme [Cohnella hashimotonis]|uniref:NAD-dependent malic enzyme n=1 Tax=Cohnella hashimotonis TaxID=2826895 RepID=A0ABT6TD71_9BACL|nr:NAD-dependent malic enzyme [Cohnella hashimotonis]MDI4644781.1 NAD-dependent malic enzyme [Cohnella hashimotonis]
MNGSNLIVRLEMDTDRAVFGAIATAIGAAGGDIVAIDVIRPGQKSIRDLTIRSDAGQEAIASAIRSVDGVRIVNISDQTLLIHLGGKLEVTPRIKIRTRDDLSRVYTPGVAKVCMAIHEDPASAFSLTIKRNTVAVVSDGSAVLGLGNIGPAAAMPVMEGKAMLFKELAGVDAFPICLDTQDSDAIVEIVRSLAPGFGGINLEDISSPRCFEIERRLQELLDIPVFHDDQHGTAVVLIASLMNAAKCVGKRMDTLRVVVCGIGAAGMSIVRMLHSAGVPSVVAVDREGILSADREYANPAWQWCAQHTNPEGRTGGLTEAIAGADVFIGVSGPGVLNVDQVKSMAADPIVFAMANPEPEIRPDLIQGIAAVIGTGRSDYPNQINNVLCFPGIFRGALDCRASRITEGMKLAAAKAIAAVVTDEQLSSEYIVPSVFNADVVENVRKAVIEAAYADKVARRQVKRSLGDEDKTSHAEHGI